MLTTTTTIIIIMFLWSRTSIAKARVIRSERNSVEAVLPVDSVMGLVKVNNSSLSGQEIGAIVRRKCSNLDVKPATAAASGSSSNRGGGLRPDDDTSLKRFVAIIIYHHILSTCWVSFSPLLTIVENLFRYQINDKMIVNIILSLFCRLSLTVSIPKTVCAEPLARAADRVLVAATGSGRDEDVQFQGGSSNVGYESGHIPMDSVRFASFLSRISFGCDFIWIPNRSGP